MAEKLWYVGIGGEKKGPFPEETVKEMIARGEVTARAYVWCEGMGDQWAPVGEVETFADALNEAPPALPFPGVGFVKGFWCNLCAVIGDPDEGLATVVGKKSAGFAALWIALGVLVFALLNVQGRAPLIATVFSATDSGWEVFGRALIHGVVLYGIWFAVLMVALGPILRTEADWRDGLTILGVSTIPTAVVGLVMFLLLWIDSQGFWAFAFTVLGAFAAPAALLLLYAAFLHASKCSRRAALCALPLVCLAANLIYALLRLGMPT